MASFTDFPGGRREATQNWRSHGRIELTSVSLDSRDDAIRVTNWIDEAVRSGRPTCCAAVAAKLPIVNPTVLTGTQADMKVNCQNFWSRS